MAFKICNIAKVTVAGHDISDYVSKLEAVYEVGEVDTIVLTILQGYNEDGSNLVEWE